MTWAPGGDLMVGINVTVLLVILLGCLIGVAGGFMALFNWALQRLGWS